MPKARRSDARRCARQVGFRVGEELLPLVDQYAHRMKASSGLSVTRSDAIRLLLRRGLAAEAAGERAA